MKKVLFFLSFLFLGIITITLAGCSKKYMIRFYAEYDSATSEYKTLLEEKKVAKGDAIVYEGPTPLKPSDSNYTYAFKCWDHELGEAKEDDNYYAVFTSTKILKNFTIVFQNYDGKVLQTSTVKEGDMPKYTGETPTRPSNDQYDYTFKGWNKEIVAASKDEKYTATYTQTAKSQNVTITWEVEGTTSTSEISKGGKAIYTSTPTKASTASKTYTFAGWKVNGEGDVIDLNSKTFDSDTRLVATFTEATRQYEITWVVDGTSTKENLDYGATPTHTAPTKTATAEHSYTFAGWTPEIASVSANATYTAVFDVTDLYSVKLNNTVTAVTDTKTGTDKLAFTLELAKDDVIVISLGDNALKFVEHENATSYTAPVDGEYKFFINADNNAYVETPTLPATYTLKGIFDGWGDGYELTLANDVYSVANVFLLKGALIKVTDGSSWIGYTALTDNNGFTTDTDNNIIVPETAYYDVSLAGSELSVNKSTKAPVLKVNGVDVTVSETSIIPTNVNDQFEATLDLTKDLELAFVFENNELEIAKVEGNANLVNGKVTVLKAMDDAKVYIKFRYTEGSIEPSVYVSMPADVFEVRINQVFYEYTDIKEGTDLLEFKATLKKNDVVIINFGQDAIKDSDGNAIYTAPYDAEYTFYVNANKVMYIEIKYNYALVLDSTSSLDFEFSKVTTDNAKEYTLKNVPLTKSYTFVVNNVVTNETLTLSRDDASTYMVDNDLKVLLDFNFDLYLKVYPNSCELYVRQYGDSYALKGEYNNWSAMGDVLVKDQDSYKLENVMLLAGSSVLVYKNNAPIMNFETLTSTTGLTEGDNHNIKVDETGYYTITVAENVFTIEKTDDVEFAIGNTALTHSTANIPTNVNDQFEGHANVVAGGELVFTLGDDAPIDITEAAGNATIDDQGVVTAKKTLNNAAVYLKMKYSEGKIVYSIYVEGPNVEYLVKASEAWLAANAITKAYVFNSNDRDHTYAFLNAETNNTSSTEYYKFSVPSKYDSIIFVRMNPDAADLESWSAVWNQTNDLELNEDDNVYVLDNSLPASPNKVDGNWNKARTITWTLNSTDYIKYLVVGEAVSLPTGTAFQQTGYELKLASGELPATMPDEDLAYTLTWEILKFTVVFLNGTDEIYRTTINYHNHPEDGNTVPTKERAGYTCVFDGWAKSSSPTQKVNLEDQFIEEDTTYVALFVETPNQVDYTVKYLLQDVTNASLYVEDTTLRETLQGNTDDNTQAQDKTITGFTLFDLTQVKIKADGSTVVEVKYNRKVMTVTLDKNGASNDGTAQIVYGATSANSVNKSDYAGHDFVGCALEAAGTHIIINADGSFNNYEGYVVNSKWINTSDNIKLYLIWSIQTFDITFDGNGATTGEMSKQTVNYNANVTLTANAYARTGYIYQGWNTESDGTGTDYTNGAEIENVTANIMLYAKWTPIKYTIAFNANEGTGSIDSITNVEYGADVTLPVNTITREGYIFVGWALTATGEAHYSDHEVVSNLTTTNNDTVTLYAVWTQKFVVTYVLNGGTIDDKTTYKEFYEKGTTVNVTQTSKTPTKVGHTFEGWYANEGLTTPAVFGEMNTSSSEGMIVYAKYTENSYTLTWVFNGGTPASDNYTLAGSVKYGTNIVYPTLSKTGYTMVWDDVPPTTMPADDLTITAIWTAKTFTVTFDPNGGALPGSDTLEVTYDQKYPDLPHATKTNYTLEGWFTASTGGTEIHGGDADGDVVQITSDVTYYAHWVGDAFNVDFMDGETKHATVGQTFGSTYNLPANNPTKEGHTFKGWYTASTDGDKIDASTTITTKTATFYAQYTKTEYTITYHNVEGATHSNPSTFYIDSETITLTVASKPYSTFLGWFTTIDGNTEVTQIPNGTKTSIVLYAHWRDNQYTIHFDKNGSENVTGVMVNMTCDYGHKYNLNANAYSWDYYNFLGWTVNQDGSGTLYTDGQEVENLSSTDGATVTLYAKWQALYVVEVNGTEVTVSEVTPESGNKYQFEYALTSGNTMTVHHGENLLKIGEEPSNETTYTAATTGVHTVYVNASDRLFISAYTYFFKGDFNNWGETTPLVWAPSKNAYELENVFLIKGSGVKVEYGDNNWYGYDSLTDKTGYTRGTESHNDDIILNDDNATGYYTISFAWATKKITLTRTSGPAYTFNDAAMSPNATGLNTSLWNDQFYLDTPVEAGDTLSFKLGENTLTFTYSSDCKNLEEVNSVKQFKRDDDHAKIYLKLKYVVNAGIVSINYEVYTSATDTYSLVGYFNNWSQRSADFLVLDDGTYTLTNVFLLRNSDILLKKNAGETDETLLKYSSLTSTTNLSDHETNIRVGETGYYTITYSSTGPVFTVIKTANDNTVISVNDEQMQENANNQFELEKALTAGTVLTFKANGDAIGIRNLTGNVEKDGYDLVVKTTFLSKILVSLYYENGTIVYDLDIDEPKEYKLCIDSDLDHGSSMTWNTEYNVYEIENVVIIKDCDARAGLGDNLIGNSIKSSETAKYRVTLTKNEVLSIEKTNDIVVEVNNHQMTIDRTDLGVEYKEQYKLTEQAFSDDEQLTFTINGVSQIIYKVEGNALLNPSTGVAAINYGIDGLNGESIYFKLKYDNGNLVAHIYVDGPKDFVVMYLDPNIWNDPDPTKVERYEVYAFKDGVRSDWFTMKAVTGTNLYTAKISTELYDKFIFVRCDSTQAEHNWDSKWNQSYDLTVNQYHKKVYKITAWGTGNSEGSFWENEYSVSYNPE